MTYTELKKMYEEDVVGEYDGIAYLKDVTRYDAKTGILTEDIRHFPFIFFHHIPFRRSAISPASGVLLPKKPCNPAQRLV